MSILFAEIYICTKYSAFKSVQITNHTLRQQKRQVSYLSYLLANNHRSDFCFVALLRIECVSEAKAIMRWGSLIMSFCGLQIVRVAVPILLSIGNVSPILFFLFFCKRLLFYLFLREFGVKISNFFEKNKKFCLYASI